MTNGEREAGDERRALRFRHDALVPGSNCSLIVGRDASQEEGRSASRHPRHTSGGNACHGENLRAHPFHPPVDGWERKTDGR